ELRALLPVQLALLFPRRHQGGPASVLHRLQLGDALRPPLRLRELLARLAQIGNQCPRLLHGRQLLRREILLEEGLMSFVRTDRSSIIFGSAFIAPWISTRT